MTPPTVCPRRGGAVTMAAPFVRPEAILPRAAAVDTVERMRARVLIGVLVLAVTAACGSTAGPGEASTSTNPATGQQTAGQQTAGQQTAPSTPPDAVPTETVSEAPTTIVTTPTDPTLIPPPPSTPEPAPTAADCPYLSNAEASEANGQRIAKTETIATEPYPICVFYRPDGTVMAATRIVVADTPDAAVAAVNQHVPVDESFPATHPAGWSGGAMSTPDGLPDYPDAGSIYAVSKGTIAVIAVSNQKQSIKGRQMVIDIVTNLGL